MWSLGKGTKARSVSKNKRKFSSGVPKKKELNGGYGFGDYGSIYSKGKGGWLWLHIF